ncbi:MAG TPA: J domain-containing protein [Anaerolineae bacterium]|nr:J domain-containing protein [Anaerolineae bacterium]
MKLPTLSPHSSSDPYGVLGIAHTASTEEVKKAYFALVRQHPPEKDPEAFKRIRAAYEQLRDPTQRQQTDLLRWQTWIEPALEPVPTVETLHATSLQLDPALAPVLDRADVIRAARALSDLGRTDFREDFHEVRV